MTTEGPARRVRTGRAFVALGAMAGVAALMLFGYAGWQRWGTATHEADAQTAIRTDYDAAATATSTDEPTSTVGPTASTDVDTVSDTAGDDVDVHADSADLLPGGIERDLLAARFPLHGPALAMMQIPAIDLTKFVMRDVTVEALRDGPGHYRGTPRPGFRGNTAIAGHRTTYGAPFGRVDELQPGDEIIVSSRDGRFTYRVVDPAVAFAGFEDETLVLGEGHAIVDPDDTWVVGDFGDSRLTLTSCHPENTSRERIVVTAALVSEPAPAPAFDVFGGRGADELAELVTETFDDERG